MKTKGWEVTATDYHFDKEIYACRHQLRSGNSPTLRIARYVLEHYSGFAILYHLDNLRVAAAMKAKPGSSLVVIQRGTEVVLEEW